MKFRVYINGGTCIDVLNIPLKSDMDTLLNSWLSTMKYLEPAQAMAIPSFDENRRGVSFSLNVSWKDYLKS